VHDSDNNSTKGHWQERTMADRFFAKISNDVLRASEDVVNRMEAGLDVLFGSGRGESVINQPSAVPAAVLAEDQQDDYLEDVLRGSPLQGMAESVLGDIMSSQVCFCVCFLSWFRFEVRELC
jgi:hypothetical protein